MQKYITRVAYPRLKGCHHLKGLGEWRIVRWRHLLGTKGVWIKKLPAIKRIDITPDCSMKISGRGSPLSEKFSPE